jgi:hypothetical protein
MVTKGMMEQNGIQITNKNNPLNVHKKGNTILCFLFFKTISKQIKCHNSKSMKLILKSVFLIVMLSFFGTLQAQKKKKPHPLDNINCPITQNELLLDGRHFASVPPVFLKVYNEVAEYATLQFGKRNGVIFLYFKIFTDNTCVRQEQPLELYFENGEILGLKNQFKVNCDGNVVLELSVSEITRIRSHLINKIKLFTLNKDYEFSPTDADNKLIRDYLTCLKYYKVKNN